MGLGRPPLLAEAGNVGLRAEYVEGLGWSSCCSWPVQTGRSSGRSRACVSMIVSGQVPLVEWYEDKARLELLVWKLMSECEDEGMLVMMRAAAATTSPAAFVHFSFLPR